MSDIIDKISAMNFKPSGKYNAKLDFDQRCEILALYRTGQVSRAALAAAYDIDRRTVAHIYNAKSKHYHSVREEEKKLGPAAFLEKYLTENVLVKLRKVKADEVKEKAGRPILAKRTHSRFAGVHIVRNDMCDHEHRILIQWLEKGLDDAGPGWYYQDADGTAPELWLHNGEKSRRTSKDCLDAVKENLAD